MTVTILMPVFINKSQDPRLAAENREEAEKKSNHNGIRWWPDIYLFNVMNRFDATFLAGIHCFCNLFAFDTFFPGDIWGPLPAVFVLPQCWFCFLYFFFIFCWHWYCWMPFIFDGRHWYAIHVKCEMDVEIYLSTVSRFLLPVWFLQLLSPDQGVVVGRHI